MDNVDFLIKIRDAGQLIADAANEYLEKLGPKDVHTHSWDPSKIKWTEAKGSKGPYMRSEDVYNEEFKAMIEDLEAHNGKLTRNGWFFWKFSESAVVGRKKRR